MEVGCGMTEGLGLLVKAGFEPRQTFSTSLQVFKTGTWTLYASSCSQDMSLSRLLDSTVLETASSKRLPPICRRGYCIT